MGGESSLPQRGYVGETLGIPTYRYNESDIELDGELVIFLHRFPPEGKPTDCFLPSGVITNWYQHPKERELRP